MTVTVVGSTSLSVFYLIYPLCLSFSLSLFCKGVLMPVGVVQGEKSTSGTFILTKYTGI